MKRLSILALLIFSALPLFLSAAEYREGNIKLVLWEKTGRFSLYYVNEKSQSQTLFYDQDPRTSYVSVLLNDRAYKLGDSVSFKTSIAEGSGGPAFIFESSRLIVTQDFSFIKTAGSGSVNGIEIKITLESKSVSDISAGFRFVLDTSLGEKGSAPHFFIDSRPVNYESVVYRNENISAWVSKNNSLALMGSITLPGIQGPDSVQFANWKRLNDVSWKLPYEYGRNFNAPPYSIGDSAACYYFEPRTFGMHDRFSAAIYLALEDSAGFGIQESGGYIVSVPGTRYETPVTDAPAPAGRPA